MKTTRQNYLEFVEDWVKDPKNAWKSFTMWCALYDFAHGRNWTLADLGIEDEINEIICSESGASYDWVEWLNDDAKLEILDISILCELWQQIEDEENGENEEDEED